MIRIGHGYDIHRLESNNESFQFITVCGVNIPHTKSLVAHSDGDFADHALCDALLGALSLGDIGQHFPDSDPQYKGKDSRFFLTKVYDLILSNSYQLANADLTILAEKPKMKPYILAMHENLAVDLKCSINQVSVKATTHEKMDSIGEGLAIAAHAVVLLERISK